MQDGRSSRAAGYGVCKRAQIACCRWREDRRIYRLGCCFSERNQACIELSEFHGHIRTELGSNLHQYWHAAIALGCYSLQASSPRSSSQMKLFRVTPLRLQSQDRPQHLRTHDFPRHQAVPSMMQHRQSLPPMVLWSIDLQA